VLDIAINAKTSEVIRVLQIDFIEAWVKAQKHMHKNQGVAVVNILLWEWKRNTYVMDYAFHNSTILMYTIFARNYGTATVISYNLKGIAPPFPQFNVAPTKIWCLDARRQHWNGSGRESGKNVSGNGMLQPNACEN
jgi:hypothetical protein